MAEFIDISRELFELEQLQVVIQGRFRILKIDRFLVSGKTFEKMGGAEVREQL